MTALVNLSDASLSARYEYGPFGEPLRQTGPLANANPFGFSTKFTDVETGMLYYGYRYYNPRTGRWPSRDPSGENAQHNLAAFVRNSPLLLIDLLGKIAKGGEMLMYCRQPCEDFARAEKAKNEGWVPPSGAVICCGGVKFICTWGSDDETNQVARGIVTACLRAHERIHLPSTACDECKLGPNPVRYHKKGRAFCEEEMQGATVAKACLELSKPKCGGDEACLKSLDSWIEHEDGSYNYYRSICSDLPE